MADATRWAYRAAAIILIGLASVGLWVSGSLFVQWLESPDSFSSFSALVFSIILTPIPIVLLVAARGLWRSRTWGVVLAIIGLGVTLLMTIRALLSLSGPADLSLLIATPCGIALLLVMLGLSLRPARAPDGRRRDDESLESKGR